MIYVDTPTKHPGKRKLYSHMMSDVSLDELHRFARENGIGKHFFHKGNHYDIREDEYNRLVSEFKVKVVDSRYLVKLRALYPSNSRRGRGMHSNHNMFRGL